MSPFRTALQTYMKAQEDARSLHTHCVSAFTSALPPGTEASNSNWRRPDNNYRPIDPSPSKRGITRATRPSGFPSSTRTPKCPYCAEAHYSDECQRFPDVDSRKDRILGHCFKCLSNSHTALQCKVSNECVYCRATTHHRSLCPIQFKSQIVASTMTTLWPTEEHGSWLKSNSPAIRQTAKAVEQRCVPHQDEG